MIRNTSATATIAAQPELGAPTIDTNGLVDTSNRLASTSETQVSETANSSISAYSGRLAMNGAAVRNERDKDLVELYRNHYHSLVRMAALLLRDIGTAEEIVQDAFIAWQNRYDEVRDPDKNLSYLKSAVVNRSRTVLRHRTVIDKHPEAPMPDMPSAEQGAITLLERSEVVTALKELPERQRITLVLRYYGDLTEDEIAAAMGISPGTVKSHASRGLHALRIALEELGNSGSTSR